MDALVGAKGVICEVGHGSDGSRTSHGGNKEAARQSECAAVADVVSKTVVEDRSQSRSHSQEEK